MERSGKHSANPNLSLLLPRIQYDRYFTNTLVQTGYFSIESSPFEGVATKALFFAGPWRTRSQPVVLWILFSRSAGGCAWGLWAFVLLLQTLSIVSLSSRHLQGLWLWKKLPSKVSEYLQHLTLEPKLLNDVLGSAMAKLTVDKKIESCIRNMYP